MGSGHKWLCRSHPEMAQGTPRPLLSGCLAVFPEGTENERKVKYDAISIVQWLFNSKPVLVLLSADDE